MPTAIDLFEKARRHERLEQLRAAREHDLMPYFRVVEAEPGPVALMEGKERITLGSNNYLGLTGDARVKAARDALDHYGTGLTGSRFMNGTTLLHLELERELADWMGTEDALVYTHRLPRQHRGDRNAARAGRHGRPGRRRRSILDAVSLSRGRACGRSGTTGWTSSRRCCRAPSPTAAASWSSSTASSRWRATSRRCPT